MDNPSDNAPINTGERPFSVGVALREARQRHGMSVADIANRLKFAPRQIEALEEDNFARLPEIAFVRGFVRSYAKLLQLDPAPLLAALPQPPVHPEPQAASKVKEVRFPDGRATFRQNLAWLAGVLAVAIALGMFVWLNHDALQVKIKTPELPTVADNSALSADNARTVPNRQPSLQVESAVPEVKAEEEAPASPPKRPAAIQLSFDQDSWVEVTDKHGIYLMAQLNLAGTERRINGNPPFSLTIGNAGQVRLYYHGKQIDLAPYNRAGVAHLTLD